MSLEVMQSIFDFRLDVNNKVLLETGVVGSIVFQPFPRSIAQKALELGIKEYIANGTLPDVYCPLYMNDIDAGQEYWSRLRTRDRPLQTRLKYDPARFLQTRTGGFCLS
ncbi:uncharacterized protein AFUA_2G17380 [Aspergillus fumigatus Af293]|uniref:Uncharacterized protein n=2 Tax=Aspergillus fumigatus TaxID=746128 RepID=Q4WZD0_ASPFU|nr:hypothetical protein AFUA_2G17380 [Aspergillus fumigatus Af293]EAL94035.1 hypothetical protein AFUA_2G17380 [Aspergillus fumigatus Af293]EDP55241.1 hypothetical protein AFUB_033050 [Aspergillus fumigatus A1163]